MEPELDGMAKSLKDMLDSNPAFVNKLAESIGGNHFDKEYGFENPSIYDAVKEYLTDDTSQIFIVYNRLLKSYAGNNDSQFVIDFFAYGGATYPVFLANKKKIIDSLLLRGSQMRLLISETEGLDITNFLEVYEKVLETWAFSDVMEIAYESFIPIEINRVIAKVQLGVIGNA